MALENVDIPTLRNAIKQLDQLAALAFPIVKDFDDYARRINNPAKKKVMNDELMVLNAARNDVHANGRTCEAIDRVLTHMCKTGQAGTQFSDDQKKWVIDTLVNLRLSLSETMHVIVRAVPERHKLRGRAMKVLSRMATQTVLGGVN